jgi:hypothetical protein
MKDDFGNIYLKKVKQFEAGNMLYVQVWVGESVNLCVCVIVVSTCISTYVT